MKKQNLRSEHPLYVIDLFSSFEERLTSTMKSIVKKQYVAPQLTVYGDVKKITQGNSTGTRLDQTFLVGTVFGDLTFS